MGPLKGLTFAGWKTCA